MSFSCPLAELLLTQCVCVYRPFVLQVFLLPAVQSHADTPCLTTQPPPPQQGASIKTLQCDRRILSTSVGQSEGQTGGQRRHTLLFPYNTTQVG